MSYGLYELKRTLRKPLIWHGRRKHADVSADERWRLEHNAYRRVSRQAMGANAIDPHFYHRADLDDSAVVVDIGAFRGHVAQELVELYGCEVHAFEPNPVFLEDLIGRFADDPRVHVNAVGLGRADATLAMQQLGLGSTVHGRDDADVPTVDVTIRDVAAVFAELGHERLDYVKINIEGAEYDLLERMIETGWLDRSRYLLIQFHEWYPRAHLRRWRIRRRLRRTHDQVWNYPWIYELWCAKSEPHPPAPTYTRSELAEIRRQLRVQRETVEGS